MNNNRIIEEKYWNQFIEKSYDSSSVIRRDGKRFEDLVCKLLNAMYDNISWQKTQMTHDGNKDFKGQKNDELYWAECKNYKTKIDLKTLAATLVMAEIENVNTILFFCYSEINENTKKKLCSYSKSTNRVIYFYDGIVLDQLILKYKENILPDFFPEYLNELANRDNNIDIIPQMFCYLEKNPLLNGSVTFDINELEEMQELTIGEIIGVHIIVINTDLSKSLKVSYSLNYNKEQCAFFPLNADIKILKKSISFPTINIAPGEICHKIIYLKFTKYFPIVEIPRLTIKGGNLKKKSYSFGTISALSIHRSTFLGENYINKRNEIKQFCLNKKHFSVVLLYGGTGTGKTRMLYECSDLFLGHGYQIINFKIGNSQILFYTILQELIFALYGFNDDIIEHIIHNNYEELEAYQTKTYNEIFNIIRRIYNKKTSLSDIDSAELIPIYERMISGKYMIILDDIQNYSEEIINFFHEFTVYAFNVQRKCATVFMLAVNTDGLYNSQTIDFLTLFDKSSIRERDNIFKYEISGFEKETQSLLLLKEVLGIEENVFDIMESKGISLRPKFIIELSNLLVDSDAIEIIDGKAVIIEKNILDKIRDNLPISLEVLIDKRWQIFLKNSGKTDDYYKILISCLIFCGEINLEYDKSLECYVNDIHWLFRHGFLKKMYYNQSVYAFEHDTIKNYFIAHYADWFEIAIDFFNHMNNILLEMPLQSACELYNSGEFTQDDFEKYKRMEFPKDILFKLNEHLLRKELNRASDDVDFELISEILTNTREQLGENKVSYLYDIFENYFDHSITNKNFYKYCTIMLDYAENQLKLKNTNKCKMLYEKIVQISADRDFNEKPYLICKINNRWFVSGRVGGQCQQYNNKWLQSVKIAESHKYCNMCMENHFDKAQSLLLFPNSKNEVIRHLKAGCSIYEKYNLEKWTGHYLYRKIQISFLQKEYKSLFDEIENALNINSTNNNIQYKLYFKIQFIIFKIMLCLMKEHKYKDIELENMLEELNLLQTMQNNLQLYRCYYLYGKYYVQRSKWEQAFVFFRKTLMNLDENYSSEEILQQKRIIFEDMMINFKKYSFPFKRFDFSYFENYQGWNGFQELIGLSGNDFKQFYDNYTTPAPVSSVDGKDGYLLF